MGLYSCQALAASNSGLSSAVSPTVASLMASSSVSGRNSWSGGSSSRMVTGRPSMASRISSKSARWATRRASRAASSSAGVEARIIRRTMGSRSSARNMCSVRHRPIPSAPCRRALAASGPLSALARTPRWPARTRSAHPRMVSNSGGVSPSVTGTWPSTTVPLVPSTEIQSPSLTTVSPTANDDARDAHRLGADHRRLAPAPGHHGGVADQAAPGGEDALGGQHPVHVLGRGLAADQHHLLAPLGRGLGVVGGQVDPADGGAGRGAEAPGQHRVARPGELGVEHLVEVLAGDPLERLLLGQLDGPLPDHVDRHPERGPAGALAHPGLEHPQLALLDGELGVAHVPVVGLEAGEDGQQLGVDRRELVLQGRERLGVPDAGHHVLALGVDQEVAVLARWRRWPGRG